MWKILRTIASLYPTALNHGEETAESRKVTIRKLLERIPPGWVGRRAEWMDIGSWAF